jgi:hypothetical protein
MIMIREAKRAALEARKSSRRRFNLRRAPIRRLWYGELDVVNTAIGYAKFRSRSHDALIRVYDEASNVIETHEHAGDFKEL